MQSVQLSTTAYIHDGKAYDYSSVGTIAGNTSLSFLGRTGATPVHFHAFELSVDKGPVLIELFEAPTITSDGTAQNPRRRNRMIQEPSDMMLFGGTTFTGGTLIATRRIHDVGGGAHTEGGMSGFNGEWILKPNTDYVFRVTNQDIALCNYSALFFYYEV